jgi:hypothetical protein
MAREKQVSVRSMFGHRTRRPLVLLRLGDEVVQMAPQEAREIGHWLLEAAEAAEQDGALMAFLTKMGLDEATRAAALLELRNSRGATGGDVTATESGEDR